MISQGTYFTFDSYKIEGDKKTISFYYDQGFDNGREIKFIDILTLPEPIPDSISPALLENILHSLHIILGISYWKMYCSREMRIKTRPLTHEQAEFWNTVYTKGLGEFFYRNEIDFRGLVQFPHEHNSSVASIPAEFKNRSLVGIAGGKDSLVSLELLKKAKKPYAGIVIETNHPYTLIRSLVKKFEVPTLYIQHTLDERVFALSETGLVYNGHIPISAVYAFIMLLTAAVYDYKYIVVSNEKSANIGNVMYHGMEVNHQWSKSEEFETMFKEYIKSWVTPSIEYFSLLRPLTEIAIVERFSKFSPYFPYFSSCNRNFTVFKTVQKRHWCGNCPKCAFIFLMLSACIPKNKLTELFGQNLFERDDLVPQYRQLLGIEDIKPFDCVGTFEESTVAFYMAYKKGEYSDLPVMRMFEKSVLPGIKNIEKLKSYVFEIGDKTNIPDEFKQIL